jgi:lipopolysaccharide transport system permease protein
MTCFRQCVFGTVPDFTMLLYLGAFALTTLGIGVILFNIYDKKLALEL